jgi:hypothetical protein
LLPVWLRSSEPRRNHCVRGDCCQSSRLLNSASRKGTGTDVGTAMDGTPGTSPSPASCARAWNSPWLKAL